MSAQLTLTDADMEALLAVAERGADSADDQEFSDLLRRAAAKLRRGLDRPSRRKKRG